MSDPRYRRPARGPGSGIALYRTDHTVANMPPRTLARCKCGTLVMDEADERDGHVGRCHGHLPPAEWFT